MHGPALAGWLMVALCAATGAYCLLRMRSSVAQQRESAGGEALMGFGMAVMAVPAAVLGPPRWAWAGYAIVFGGAALRALWSAAHGSARHPHHHLHHPHHLHHLHHLVGTLAMVYMAVAMAVTPGAHAGHTSAGVPLLTGVLLLYFGGYVLRSGARLMPAAASVTEGGGAPPAAAWGDRVELATACRLSMGIAMVAMLLTM
ncbi:DUF5134 domain-containing protein [Streptomyces apocyni]|uniref:DUF5134 domain-containing protein n=1 Tax=Streptomyces apocyni TaxID=2654677 RepID=UPI0012EADA94|nr:DUF5134 domain-containing protein [Streptomyces apocyni]